MGCASESFILTLEKEEIFGSWKLHLPSHQFITELSTRWRTRGRAIESMLAGKRTINRGGNLTPLFTLAKTQMFRTAGRSTRHVDLLVSGAGLLVTSSLFCTCMQSSTNRSQVDGGRFRLDLLLLRELQNVCRTFRESRINKWNQRQTSVSQSDRDPGCDLCSRFRSRARESAAATALLNA